MTASTTTGLARAIAGLYEEFGDGPLARPLHGCEDCADTETLKRWAQTPLRQLPAKELDTYLYSALATIGDEEDFKHFFPRLFELTAADAVILDITFELVGSQLTRARWQQWPDRQRTPVRIALEELWKTLGVKEYAASAIDSIVCGVALARMDMLTLLTAWQKASAPISRANLERFMEHNRDSLKRKRRLANAFWDNSPAQEVIVADWLRSAMSVY